MSGIIFQIVHALVCTIFTAYWEEWTRPTIRILDMGALQEILFYQALVCEFLLENVSNHLILFANVHPAFVYFAFRTYHITGKSRCTTAMEQTCWVIYRITPLYILRLYLNQICIHQQWRINVLLPTASDDARINRYVFTC